MTENENTGIYILPLTEGDVEIGTDGMSMDDGDLMITFSLSATEMRRLARMLLAQADAQEGIEL